MGNGIAHVFAMNNYNVNLIDISQSDCNDCHAAGSGPEGDKKPLPTPHETRLNCLQCHVSKTLDQEFVANGFTGLLAKKTSIGT